MFIHIGEDLLLNQLIKHTWHHDQYSYWPIVTRLWLGSFSFVYQCYDRFLPQWRKTVGGKAGVEDMPYIYGRLIGRFSCSKRVFIPSMPSLAFRGSLHIVLMIASSLAGWRANLSKYCIRQWIRSVDRVWIRTCICKKCVQFVRRRS